MNLADFLSDIETYKLMAATGIGALAGGFAGLIDKRRQTPLIMKFGAALTTFPIGLNTESLPAHQIGQASLNVLCAYASFEAAYNLTHILIYRD